MLFPNYIPHKAHEFIHRLALSSRWFYTAYSWRKKKRLTAEAVMQSYEYLIDNYYPKRKVVLTSLSTFMDMPA